jgi:hypothetical protein
LFSKQDTIQTTVKDLTLTKSFYGLDMISNAKELGEDDSRILSLLPIGSPSFGGRR